MVRNREGQCKQDGYIVFAEKVSLNFLIFPNTQLFRHRVYFADGLYCLLPISQAMAMLSPAPAATPLTAAIMGFSILRKRKTIGL